VRPFREGGVTQQSSRGIQPAENRPAAFSAPAQQYSKPHAAGRYAAASTRPPTQMPDKPQVGGTARGNLRQVKENQKEKRAGESGGTGVRHAGWERGE